MHSQMTLPLTHTQLCIHPSEPYTHIVVCDSVHGSEQSHSLAPHRKGLCFHHQSQSLLMQSHMVCVQEYLSLPAGTYTFQAQATDLAGNVESTTATSTNSKSWGPFVLPSPHAIITGRREPQMVSWQNITSPHLTCLRGLGSLRTIPG